MLFRSSSPRLWAGTDTLASDQKGTFLSYHFSMVATGLAPAVFDSSVAGFYSASDPTGVSGHFTGVFQNTNGTTPGLDGFYSFDFTLDLQSWAYDNRADLTGSNTYNTSFFSAPTIGSDSAVPEPSTYGVFGALALVALAGWRRLRARKA